MARPYTYQRLSYNYKTEVQAHLSAPPQQTEETEAYTSGAVTSETTYQHGQYRHRPSIGQRDIPNSQIVKIRLRGHRLSLLTANTTDPESLRKEAVHFDEETSYWERLGWFETLTSSRGRFIVQYDKTDIDETGTPKAVIGVMEEIIAFDSEEDEDDREETKAIDKTEGDDDKLAMCNEPLIQLRNSQPVQKSSREASPQPAGPTAKKLRTSADELPKLPATTQPPPPTMANITDLRTRMCKPSHGADYRYPEDSDNDTDTDEDDDEPPDWTEYDNLDITAGKKKFLNDSEVEVLDTRVDFVQIDLVPSEVYEAAYESDGGPPGFCDYLARGQAVPELGDLTPMDVIRG